MKRISPLILVVALTSACSDGDGESPTKPAAGANDGGDSSEQSNSSSHSNSSSTTSNEPDARVSTSSDESDSGTRSDVDADAPTDESTSDGGDATDTSDAADTFTSAPDSADGEDAADAQTIDGQRSCSSDALHTVNWECADNEAGESHCVSTPVDDDCPLQWGCSQFESAVLEAEDDCKFPNVTITSKNGCGYSVIERTWGAGDTTRAFYAPSGELVGTWSMSDTLIETCSGVVPENCIDWVWETTPTNVVTICQRGINDPIDAGGDAN
jgi:hypothetical protein